MPAWICGVSIEDVTMRNRLPLWAKPLTWLLCLLPLSLLALYTTAGLNADLGLGLAPVDALAQHLRLRLPVNPVEDLIRDSGVWALRLLCLTLCLTPLRHLTGWTGWILLRRLIGLFAFFYACIHVGAYVWADQFFDVEAIVRDILKRPFITVGMVTFVLLIPLAVTSNQWSMKRLGRHWKRLHRLIYLIAPLAVLHFWWMVKRDVTEPAIYLAIVAALLLVRVVRARPRTAFTA